MNDESILLTIQGHGKEPVYMIPLIFATASPQEHARLVSDDAQNIMYDKAFRTTLASEISEPIFKDRSAFSSLNCVTNTLKSYRGSVQIMLCHIEMK